MTTRDAVDLFGIDRKYLQRRLTSGEIKAEKHKGVWTFTGKDFREWLKTQPMYRHWYIDIPEPPKPKSGWDLLEQEEQVERMLKYIDSTTLDM